MGPAADDPRIRYPAGIVASHVLDDALMAAWSSAGRRLSDSEILAITGPAPIYPMAIPRDPDSNPWPHA